MWKQTTPKRTNYKKKLKDFLWNENEMLMKKVQIPALAMLEHSMDDQSDRLCTLARYLLDFAASAVAV